MNVLANAHRALLAVHKLESIFSYSPIHCVERKIFANGINDFVALLFFVDELALVGRANVQFSTITNNAAFTYVVIAADHIEYFYVFQSNFHLALPILFINSLFYNRFPLTFSLPVLLNPK